MGSSSTTKHYDNKAAAELMASVRQLTALATGTAELAVPAAGQGWTDFIWCPCCVCLCVFVCLCTLCTNAQAVLHVCCIASQYTVDHSSTRRLQST